MAIKIRDANKADLPQILAIYNDAVVNTTAVYDYVPRTFQTQQEWFCNKEKSEHPVLVAEDVEEGDVLGFCCYGSFRAWPAYSRTIEWSVYIDTRWRNKGIGSELMPELIKRARLQEYHTIVAGIDATNEASVKLHRKLGFVQVAHFREVGWKFDRWLDLVFMQLIL